jgi:hypothetical protein
MSHGVEVSRARVPFSGSFSSVIVPSFASMKSLPSLVVIQSSSFCVTTHELAPCAFAETGAAASLSTPS